MARSFGARMGETLGQSVVIENRTGGNAVVAANATLQSPPDGYTFLVDAANQVTNPRLMANLPASSASLGSELPGGNVPSRTRPRSASAAVSALPALIGRPRSETVAGSTVARV